MVGMDRKCETEAFKWIPEVIGIVWWWSRGAVYGMESKVSRKEPARARVSGSYDVCAEERCSQRVMASKSAR